MYDAVISRKLLAFFACFLAIVLLSVVQFSWSWSQGPNNRNVSVDTTVNITGSAPIVTSIRVPASITLNAGSTTLVQCNVTVGDYNGYGDLRVVNATFHRSSVAATAPDDNNTHYTNASCVNITGEQDGFYSNYSCTFAVQYYALNGSWNCTVVANDSMHFKDDYSNTTLISPLYALNVTTQLDYGDISPGEYSPNVTANVSNVGNININISVTGYGQTPGDGLSFVCDQGTLPIGLQHYAPNSTAPYNQKKALTNAPQRVPELSVIKTSNGTPNTNTTYWEFYADAAYAAYGRCNGTIVFQAETSQ